MLNERRRLSSGITPLLSLFLCAPLALSAADLPPNMGSNLKRLVEVTQQQAAPKDLTQVHLALDSKTNRYALLPGKPNLIVDHQNRVLVKIVLDGSIPGAQVEQALLKLNAQVNARSTYRNGLLSAFIPVESAASLAQVAGVRAVHLGMRPHTNVGAVTAQGVFALQADDVFQEGLNGKGITVGILSDSFNTSGGADTALTDVQSGDLPNTVAIPGGEGLKALIEEFPNGTDEGRGMAQIVHDMAPGAALCFATADAGEVDFAENIKKLAGQYEGCNADVIVDDVSYLGEPYFSDGIITDAIDYVSQTAKPNGKRAVYFSAAGNEDGTVYASNFRKIAVAQAENLPNSPVDLTSIPSTIDIGGGFHNFAPNGPALIAQPLLVIGNPVLILQWDDPFDSGGITTNYSLLLFDSNGVFIPSSDVNSNASGADNTFITDEPVQGIAFDTTATNGSAQYYLVIARSAQGSQAAKRLKYIYFGDTILAPYLGDIRTPAVFGHEGGPNTISVAAYDVNRAPYGANAPFIPELEDFTSPGPMTIAIDDQGNRLQTAEIRLKPDVACVDGVFTTFFGQSFLPTDKFPRFFGTSAAAPCAAGIGALMLQKARRNGGPGDLSPGEVLNTLIDSTPEHDADPFFSSGASRLTSGGSLSITAQGQSLSAIGAPTDFSVALTGAAGVSLTDLTIHLPAQANLNFFVNLDTSSNGLHYHPFVLGPHSAGISATLLSPTPPMGKTLGSAANLELHFSGFSSGKYLDFDVDRADAQIGYIDDDADRIGGATYTAVLTDAHGKSTTAVGTITNQFNYNWTQFDGYGLINALDVVSSVP